jgi:hypothetical protein
VEAVLEPLESFSRTGALIPTGAAVEGLEEAVIALGTVLEVFSRAGGAATFAGTTT